jgi:hypothetical protein
MRLRDQGQNGREPCGNSRLGCSAERSDARVERTLLSVAVDVDFDVDLIFAVILEEAESHAKRATPDEGPMHLAGSVGWPRRPPITP